jgi:hypothetical protein
MGFLSKDQIATVKEDIKGDDRFFRLNMLDDNSAGYRIRFLGQAITGWEIWVTDDEGNDIKLRFEEKPDELPENAKADMSGKKEYKRFVASVIWDYQLDKIRLLDIAQPGVLGKIFAMDDDPDYGDPTGYDVKFSKTVAKKKTSYDVLAAPPRAVAPSIEKAFKGTYCNLKALFDNEDPWVDPSAAKDK